ncbi:uncharacterized protein LOC117922375 isoform X2 [Vitis riparia]|uniref:uncharacterized protein LOC117922375 isoform X2 n=1 Tax=Vitis riparia TaxID=96939 RepID=UPI00155AA593|nr:uncharacterized protein LOC117922375 isoform X2 [Vitis riparia]
MASGIEDEKLEDIKVKLFNCAMQSDWEGVVRICEQHPSAHKAIIPASGETILYMAVSDEEEKIVEELVEQISKSELDALKIGNEEGDTPLHLAASIGNIKMCKCITDKDRKLVGFPNNKAETPLFLAALRGQKDAFLFLHGMCESSERANYCRRDDGRNILHCVIDEEYFDLAFQIIHHYGDLVDSVDENGLTPLHLLASKPTAFKSGTPLSWFERIIYHCVYVEDLKEEELQQQSPQTSKRKKILEGPENYQTCMYFGDMIKTSAITIFAPNCQKDDDAENPNQGRKATSEHQDVEDPKEDELRQQCPQTSKSKQILQCPENYQTCMNFWSIIKTSETSIFPSKFCKCEDAENPRGRKTTSEKQGFEKIKKIKDMKKKHSRAVQLVDELLQHVSSSKYKLKGQQQPSNSSSSDTNQNVKERSPSVKYENEKDKENKFSLAGSSSETTNKKDKEKKNTPILIAAKNGVKEMVEKILEVNPVSINDKDEEKKNVVLLAVENRQPEVYELLVKRKFRKDSVFRAVDNNGNSALHLAAMLSNYQPWHIPGAALQMQWEMKWYKYVKNSMPPHFFTHYNDKKRTPKEVFTEAHSELLKKGGKWLNSTSSSCSVVATLIATVAFATSATVPGSFNENNGKPNLAHQSAFNLFAVSSLIALCFSVTSLVMFLAILTSRHQEDDFHEELPRKLLFGLTALFISIAAMLVSFCAGHFFVLKDELKYAALPVYAVTCLPISFFAIAQFSLYFDLAWATFRKVPQRSYKMAF